MIYCDGSSDEDGGLLGTYELDVYPTGQLFGNPLGVNLATAAGSVSKAVTGGILDVTGFFKKNKDPGRMRHIQDLVNRASAGDRGAWDGTGGNPRDNLKHWSTHYATANAKQAALAAYNALAPRFAAKPPTPGTPGPTGGGTTPGGPAILPPAPETIYSPGGQVITVPAEGAAPAGKGSNWTVPLLVLAGVGGFLALRRSRGSQSL